jgi:ribosomal protein S12 methylthiotransferase
MTQPEGRAAAPGAHERTVHFVSLGCPKNRVDSEVMLGLLRGADYRVVEDPAQAGVIVVNTCAFIGPAKQESIDTVLEMARYKSPEEGHCGTLVMTGCLAQRYAGELEKEIPEVDHFIGTGEFTRLVEILDRSASRPGASPRALVFDPEYVYDARTPRINSMPAHTAYVKVSEGCDNRCAFCIIPKLRGDQRSRTIDDIVAEVHGLAATGVKEVNLVAQDLTAWGYDLPGRPALAALLRALCRVDDVRWIRLHYAYPRTFGDELIDVIAGEEKIVKYIDMPLQHISDRMLRLMRRGRDAAFIRGLLDRLRARIDGLVLRTTFIVGFPGETEAEFEALCEFLREQRFDRAGVFPYSDEEGTPACEYEGKLDEDEIARRHARIMAVQQRISRERQRAQVGRRIEVLVDGPSEETEHLLVGRDYGRAPGIDGVVYINDAEDPRLLEDGIVPGRFYPVEVTQAGDYDLVGRVVA